MISLMPSLFMLLMTVIIVNSTTPNCRQTPFFNRLRKRNRVPPKSNQFDPFLHSFLKYGSTARPPGTFHLRHSLKEFISSSEFPQPSFEIFFIKKITDNNNNNDNNINYIDNGGSGTDDTNDNPAPVPVDNNSNINVVGHRSNRIDTWFTDRIEPIHSLYKFNKDKFNIDGISTTTTTPATATINYKISAEGISHEDGEAGLSVWSTDRIESNQFNSGKDQIESNRYNYKYKYKFNIDGISTTTTTPATATINYKTSAEGISNEGGEEAEAAAARLSEWSANLFESNRCNSISNNNNNNNSNTGSTNKDNYNKTFHHFFLFRLISLYLIITKSFTSKQFTKEPKEKQHHHHQQQQHYHGKRRHQFHLEQHQKHQHFKQEQHNMERMVTSIVLKLSLVAWDMWAFRNVY